MCCCRVSISSLTSHPLIGTRIHAGDQATPPCSPTPRPPIDNYLSIYLASLPRISRSIYICVAIPSYHTIPYRTAPHHTAPYPSYHACLFVVDLRERRTNSTCEPHRRTTKRPNRCAKSIYTQASTCLCTYIYMTYVD